MGFFVRSAAVPEFKNAARFKPWLRRDFRYQCAYCEITERYRRGSDSFGVDHFQPKKIFPELEFQYPNLYYCCNSCNRYKGVRWPRPEELAAGFKFADPCEGDPYDEHLTEQPNGYVRAETPAGQYMLDILRLNRDELIRFRNRRTHIRNPIDRCVGIMRDDRLDLDEDDRRAITHFLADLEQEWQASQSGSPWPPEP